jgi:hypothetical protein
LQRIRADTANTTDQAALPGLYINTLMIQRVLAEPSWFGRLTAEDTNINQSTLTDSEKIR